MDDGLLMGVFILVWVVDWFFESDVWGVKKGRRILGGGDDVVDGLGVDEGLEELDEEVCLEVCLLEGVW